MGVDMKGGTKTQFLHYVICERPQMQTKDHMKLGACHSKCTHLLAILRTGSKQVSAYSTKHSTNASRVITTVTHVCHSRSLMQLADLT